MKTWMGLVRLAVTSASIGAKLGPLDKWFLDYRVVDRFFN